MGCPGTPVTAGPTGVRLGDTVITQSYPAPNLWNSYSLSTGTINNVMDNQANPSGLDANGACACCCSGLNGGLTPTWSHFYQYINSSITPISESTWPTERWLPGGSTGIYMNNIGDKFYFFNVGQKDRCGQIGAGLYDMSPTRTNTLGGTYDILHVVMDHFLLNGSSPWYIETDPTLNGGYSLISLCVPCFQIGSDPDVADTCPPASCANPMDYGTQIPSVNIPGPGHNLVEGCATGTVWDTCVDDPCSPNGMCLGPPSTTAPTGCIQEGSPLTNNPPDNVCFDCAGKPLFNPCYGATTTNPTNYGIWAHDDTWSQSGQRNGFDCGNTQAGDGTLSSYSSAGGDYYADYKQDPSNWDSCCMYKQYGCVNPSFANFNAIASLDCAGNQNPGDLTWYGSDPLDAATFGLVMCSQASWLNGGYAQITDLGGNNFSWSVPLLDPVTGLQMVDQNGTPIISSQGTANQPGGADVPCNTLTVNGAPNPGGHPLSWSKTGYASADQCCCNNDGCVDSGAGGTVWDNTGNFPPNGGPNNVYPPLGPGVSPTFNTVGGYGWIGTAPLYYQGYQVTIGVSSPTPLSQGPVAASNFCGLCSGDCNGDPIGTNNPGWADCCWYQIPGCMESSNANSGNHPDIFGGGAHDVWNYNPLATYDDGSCFHQEPIQGCIDDGGLGLSNVVGPYLAPTYNGIPANNFDPDANIMALGTCTWNEGCPDPLAVNYDPCADPNELANIVSGTYPACVVTDVNGALLPGFYPSVPNATLCNYNIPGAGPGCMDPQAINFNPLATQGCGGLFPPLDFSCCSYPIEGCTDPNAWNYNAMAVIDDGSCEYQINPFQEGVNFLDGTNVLLCRDPLTKEEVLMNVCEPTEIQSEIFIERGKQTVFEPNQRLGEIKTMGGLVNHGYGYYKIKKQE